MYFKNNKEYRYMVTDVETNPSGDAMLVTVCEVNGEKQTPYRKMEVSRRGLIWVETLGGAAFDEPLRMLQCPVVVGDELPYRTSGRDIPTTEGTMKVVGVEEVEVPAGKFTAVRIEDEYSFSGRGKKNCNTHWFAPGVGLVKWSSGQFESVLKSFKPGQD